MKAIIILIVGLLITGSNFAQEGINYKALIKDNLGNILNNQNIGLQFQIREASINGSAVYTETHTTTTDSNGIIVLNIGTGNSSDVFGSIDWSSNNHWLNLQIDITGGTNYIDISTTQFMTVPYALSASNVFSGNYNELTNRPIIDGLTQITENNQIGWRLSGANSNNHGNIGNYAVDLSYSGSESFINGALGDFSVAIGNENSAFGDFSTVMGLYTTAGGVASTATGLHTIASNNASFVVGQYNVNVPTGLFIVGKGSPGLPGNEDIRKNALVVYDDGSITAPSFSVSEIDAAGDIALTTKEFTDINYLSIGGNVVSNHVGIGRSNPGSLFEVAHESSSPTASNYTNSLSIHNIGTGRSWQLHTVGSHHLNLYRNGSYRGYFHEATGVYSSISDRRTKKDITALENGTLNKVMQLNPVSYLMKDQADTKRSLGLISQEVQKIFPSITTYVDEADLITLSYTELIPILIKALQEQQTVIEAQQITIKAQNTKDVIQDKSIEALIARLNLLESKSSN